MPPFQAHYDLAVIGAGPAGSSAAITAARRGARVLLLESDEFPRHKVCGEFVSAESLDVLRDLLQFVPDAERVLRAAPIIERVRLMLDDRTAEARLTPPAMSISRYDLDLLLWRAAQQAGVETCSNCEVKLVDGVGPFRLDASSGAVEASAVVVAAGRWSRFSALAAVPAGPKWVGLKGHFREPRPSPSTDLYFFEFGYCGVQPIAKDVVNACATVRSDRATSLDKVFSLHPLLATRSREWRPVTDPVSTAPLIYRFPEPVRDGLMFVGDAAAFIDPFVGDGISIALRTGQLAAAELASVFDGSSSLASALAGYQRQYREQYLPVIAAAARVRSLLSWPRPVQLMAFEFLRAPGVIPYIIRRTRRGT